MKNVIISLILVLGLMVSVPTMVSADEQEVCTASYGQGVVCGKKSFDEPEKIIEAGLAEDMRLIGLALITSSVFVYYKGKKGTKSFEFGR